MNRQVGNLPPMPAVFPGYPAPVVRNTDANREVVMMRWGVAATAAHGRPAGHQHPDAVLEPTCFRMTRCDGLSVT